jgi:lipopolysaccharide/colanic/teichoic acid biosynthesis glycosyltransferase
MAKRWFDVIFSAIGLVVLSPVLVLIAILIKATSPGPVFYRSERRGRFDKPFRIWKLRTMVAEGEKIGPLATPEGDPRITKVGRVLRKFKLDELPQLINVLVGEMSLVGPRPEAELYFQYYTPEERKTILSVRPGMTDYGSLYFHDEGKLLEGSDDPVKTYIEKIKDKKVQIQMEYIRDRSLWVDIKVILATITTIITTRIGGRRRGAEQSHE